MSTKLTLIRSTCVYSFEKLDEPSQTVIKIITTDVICSEVPFEFNQRLGRFHDRKGSQIDHGANGRFQGRHGNGLANGSTLYQVSSSID